MIQGRSAGPGLAPGAVEAYDRGGMLGLVASLGTQLREGYAGAIATPGLPSSEGVRSILICGMGGSGVAGDVFSSLYAPLLSVPVAVCKGYSLPGFAGRDTVVLAVSFSGNTEESVAAYGEAVERGCRVVAVSAGGLLASLAEADGLPHLRLPDHVPLPRAALGYLAAAPIGIAEALGLIPSAAPDVERTAGLLDEMAQRLGPQGQDPAARDVAGWLGERVPVIWGSEGLAVAAALRWKTQTNENAKLPAWSSALPELDHNEIEGWSPASGRAFALVVLRHAGEHPRTGARVTATLDLVREAGLGYRQVGAEGSTPMEWLFSLIMMGDFVTTYQAIARGVDPSPIPALTALKERLKS
jgi:glucose/mannose-6-phosphate isomerase